MEEAGHFPCPWRGWRKCGSFPTSGQDGGREAASLPAIQSLQTCGLTQGCQVTGTSWFSFSCFNASPCGIPWNQRKHRLSSPAIKCQPLNTKTEHCLEAGTQHLAVCVLWTGATLQKSACVGPANQPLKSQ